MKLKLLAIAVLALLASFGSQAFGQSINATSFPSGVEVFVDNVDTNTVTPSVIKTTAGNHTVLFSAPSGYVSVTETVSVTDKIVPVNAVLLPVLLQGPVGPQGPQGVQGATGATGDTGPQGFAATIQVGTVSCGQNLSVTNSGTNQSATFNFELPCAPLTGGTLNPDNGGGLVHLNWFPVIGDNATSDSATGIGTFPVNRYIVSSWTVTVSGPLPNTMNGIVSLIDQTQVDINTAGLVSPFVSLFSYVIQCQIGPNQSCTVQNDGTFLPLNPSDSYIVRIAGLSPSDAANVQITWSIQ